MYEGSDMYMNLYYEVETYEDLCLRSFVLRLHDLARFHITSRDFQGIVRFIHFIFRFNFFILLKGLSVLFGIFVIVQ